MFEKFRDRIGFATPALIAFCLMTAMPLMSAEAGTIMVEFCTADGVVRSVAIPVEKNDNGNEPGDCASPCHAFLSRKPAKENGNRT